MRLVERFRLCYRMLVFVFSTIILWIGLELEVLCLRKQRLDAINKWVPMWAKFNLRVFGVEIDARGEHLDRGRTYPGADPNGVGRIFIANHRSGMDIPLMFTVAETRVISRHDLATWPLLGRAAQRVGTLFVDRESKKSGASVLRTIDATLKRGEGVAMFPEGTAYDGDEVHEFRTGAFNAARRARAEIIPVGIAYGDDRAYYSGLFFLPHMVRIAYLKRLRVSIEVGQPLQGNGNAVELKNEARQCVQELVNRARVRLDDKDPIG
ncbi:MAG: lysophospholipid acyltransferase family protein [Planctomycetota bacterium]